MLRELTMAGLVGCSTHTALPGESVSEVCRVENHGKEVAASGYLMAPTIIVGCEHSCTMVLTERGTEPNGIDIRLPTGTGPVTMAPIRSKFEGSAFPGQVERLDPSDFRLTDRSGRVVGPGDVVRVTGKLSAIELGGQPSCSLSPNDVQAL